MRDPSTDTGRGPLEPRANHSLTKPSIIRHAARWLPVGADSCEQDVGKRIGFVPLNKRGVNLGVLNTVNGFFLDASGRMVDVDEGRISIEVVGKVGFGDGNDWVELAPFERVCQPEGRSILFQAARLDAPADSNGTVLNVDGPRAHG